MEANTIVTIIIVSVGIVYLIVLYNGLVSLKHAVAKHLANIDVLLKQRHEELPKLVETCRQYMAYEKVTLERVIRARNRVAEAQNSRDLRALGKAESQLRQDLGQLFALAEGYPVLRASEGFQRLQTRITDLENSIADRREVYNEAVNNNNVRIEQFPDVIVAYLFGFGSFEMLEFSAETLRDVDVRALFSGA